MSDELKRCQYCGSRATIVDYEGASLFGYYIACRNKKCELSKMPDAQNLFRTEAEAIAAWNDRANDNMTAKSVVSDKHVDANDGSMAQADNRERLEEDAFELASTIWHKGCAWESGVEDINLVGWKEEDVIALLDRQAAITRHEVLHSNPMCGGRDVCHATNLPDSESVERETPNTAGIGALKDEIRDFDVWSVAYEIYCAGGYVDNGSEPNPPTSGIYELLDRQAAITRAEVFADGEFDCMTCAAKAELREQVEKLTAERDHFRKHVDQLKALIADIARKQPYTFDPEAPYTTLDTIGDYLDELQGDVASLRAERDELRDECRELKEAMNRAAGNWAKKDAELRVMTTALNSINDKLAEKQRVCDMQRDSFLKLEAENAELRKELDGCSR